MRRWPREFADRVLLAACALVIGSVVPGRADGPPGLHLFVLAGQSNMGGLRPEASVVPELRRLMSKAEFEAVKVAYGGTSIAAWDPEKKTRKKRSGEETISLYKELVQKTREALGDREPATVTFCWMQGERDGQSGEFDRAAYRPALYEGRLRHPRPAFRPPGGRPDPRQAPRGRWTPGRRRRRSPRGRR